MTLLKLRSVPCILIEDDGDKCILPLLAELVQPGKVGLKIFCYEQPQYLWKDLFKDKSNLNTYTDFVPENFNEYVKEKFTVIIDSINQMVMLLGWHQCLKYIQKLNSHPNISQMILVLHNDCLTTRSKVKSHLNFKANAIISYGSSNTKVSIEIKKSGKVTKSQEQLHYDSKNHCLKATPITSNKESQSNQSDYPQPGNLTTFKIEVAQIEMMEKYKLKLPHMSKINHNESKVYYEPDAVDDWDEEDPDDDLDI